MSFSQPWALSLLSTALLVLLLSRLRNRQKRREVSALFLWKDLRDAASARTQRMRRLLDPLLLLQWATLLAIVFASAQPFVMRSRTGFTGLALIIDASASMRTVDAQGRSRYEKAVQRGSDILAAYPSSSVSIVQFTNHPQVVEANAQDPGTVKEWLETSSPTWFADGDAEDLARAVSAIGGPGAYEAIVLLSDHPVAGAPFELKFVPIDGGDNLGITAFTVREDPDGRGVSAFIELTNGTDAYQSGKLALDDEFSRTSMDVLLEPQDVLHFVVPFPVSRGTRFTATLSIEDDFPYDNTRYFSLNRTIDLRVAWYGQTNRFLRAALEAVLPMAWVPLNEPADLTVVYDTHLTDWPTGDVLAVHSTITGSLGFGQDQAGGTAAEGQDAPSALLDGIEPAALYVERVPEVIAAEEARTLLTVGGQPLLLDFSDAAATRVALTADLYGSNLPITIDFPLLIRNLIAKVSRVPTSPVHAWTTVGDAIEAPGGATLHAVTRPNGEDVPLEDGRVAFFPDQPGSYALHTDRGQYAAAVNIAATESAAASTATAAGLADLLEPETATRLQPIGFWPWLAGAALLLLPAEYALYLRKRRNEGSLR